jgi:hypothetical protein
MNSFAQDSAEAVRKFYRGQGIDRVLTLLEAKLCPDNAHVSGCVCDEAIWALGVLADGGVSRA